jgi:type VI secretion system FHA domain protein
MFGQPGADPFADLLAPKTPTPEAGVSGRRSDAPVNRDTIPSDFDPFADLNSSLSSKDPFADLANPARLPDDFNLELRPASSQSIDQLFGLKSDSGADPFALGHPLGEPDTSVDRASSLDPLVVLGAVPPPQPKPGAQRDNGMEIRAAFNPPAVSFPEVEPAPAAAEPPRPAVGPPDKNSMLFSWNAPDQTTAGGAIRTVIIPSSRQAEPAAPRSEELPPASVSEPYHAARVEPAPKPVPTPARPDVAAADELLRAFLAGAGVPELDMREPLTPQMMNRIGQLLRASTEGTLDLLLARALIKREVRAEVTMIVANENNPLKFSPNVEVALAHLLAPRGQGFMGPVAAMKDACDDLRAHQFGFMAGMRAALDGVLRRFDPEQLEQRLTDKTFVDSMLPMNRKAKLWSLFAELYADITREAQDDFHALFGKEFLRAYESQLDLLEKHRDGAPTSDKP